MRKKVALSLEDLEYAGRKKEKCYTVATKLYKRYVYADYRFDDLLAIRRLQNFVQSYCPSCQVWFDSEDTCMLPDHPRYHVPSCRFNEGKKGIPHYSYPIDSITADGEILQIEGSMLELNQRNFWPNENSTRIFVLPESELAKQKTAYAIQEEIPMRRGTKFWTGDTRWEIIDIRNPFIEPETDSAYQSFVHYKLQEPVSYEYSQEHYIPQYMHLTNHPNTQAPSYQDKDEYVIPLGSTALVLRCIGKRNYTGKKRPKLKPETFPKTNPTQALRKEYLYKWVPPIIKGDSALDSYLNMVQKYPFLYPAAIRNLYDLYQPPLAYYKGQPCFLRFIDTVSTSCYKLPQGNRVFGHSIEAELYYFEADANGKFDATRTKLLKSLKLQDRQQLRILGREFYVRVAKYNHEEYFHYFSEYFQKCNFFGGPDFEREFPYSLYFTYFNCPFGPREKSAFYEVELIEGKGFRPPPMWGDIYFVSEQECLDLGGELHAPE